MNDIQLLERYKLALSSANIGFWDWDILTNELVWDDILYEVYGVKKEDFSGAYQAWESSLHPEDLKSATEELQHSIKEGKVFNTVFKIVWPDESVHYIQAFGKTINNEEGKAIRMSGLNWDITEKVLAETALKNQMSEMERMNLLMVDREKKMIALKKEITQLKKVA